MGRRAQSAPAADVALGGTAEKVRQRERRSYRPPYRVRGSSGHALTSLCLGEPISESVPNTDQRGDLRLQFGEGYDE